jgi:hypothetical protein
MHHHHHVVVDDDDLYRGKTCGVCRGDIVLLPRVWIPTFCACRTLPMVVVVRITREQGHQSSSSWCHSWFGSDFQQQRCARVVTTHCIRLLQILHHHPPPWIWRLAFLVVGMPGGYQCRPERPNDQYHCDRQQTTRIGSHSVQRNQSLRAHTTAIGSRQQAAPSHSLYSPTNNDDTHTHTHTT